MKKILLQVILTILIALIILLPIILIGINTTVVNDYREGYFESTDPPQLLIDNKAISVAHLDLGDTSPFNLIVYFGGYPKPGSYIHQDGYWFTWKPNGHIFCLWISYP